MAEVDTIDIPDVTPVTRTVATMSKLIKTAGLPTDAAAAQTDATSVTQTSILKQLSAYLLALGAKADAKSTATDTTAVSGISIWKQISASVQTMATALGTTAFTRGAGPSDSNTLRVTVDNTQTDGSAYETVAASATAQVMGSTGAIGDFLSHVVVSPAAAACGVVTIFDNATTIVAFPGGATTALSNLIPFIIPVGITSTSGAWKITTGANVSCVAVGRFT